MRFFEKWKESFVREFYYFAQSVTGKMHEKHFKEKMYTMQLKSLI
jgi:hypothetical protein